MRHILKIFCNKYIVFCFISFLPLVSWAQCKPISTLPYVIDKSGNYCLTNNLRDTRGFGHAIDINADNVVLDLQGYSLQSKLTNFSKTIGIAAYNDQGHKNITIKNGSIRDVDSAIGLLNKENVGGHLIENLHITNCRNGIYLEGSDNHIRNNWIRAIPATIVGDGIAIATAGRRNHLVGNEIHYFGTSSAIASGTFAIIEGNRLFAPNNQTGGGIVIGTSDILKDNLIVNFKEPYLVASPNYIDAGGNIPALPK